MDSILASRSTAPNIFREKFDVAKIYQRRTAQRGWAVHSLIQLIKLIQNQLVASLYYKKQNYNCFTVIVSENCWLTSQFKAELDDLILTLKSQVLNPDILLCRVIFFEILFCTTNYRSWQKLQKIIPFKINIGLSNFPSQGPIIEIK